MTLAPIIKLIGSKQRQRKNILPIIERYSRLLYVEPFGGAGGMLFGKAPEKQEIYNDINGAFVSLFRAVKNPETMSTVQTLLELSPMSRELWREARDLAVAYLRGDDLVELKARAELGAYSDEIAVAYAIFYAQNCGFSGKLLNAYGGGGKSGDSSATAHLYNEKRRRLPRYCRRLQTVAIENLDALDCVRKYDDATTLFYLDPPYETGSDEYGVAFHERALVDLLKTIKGAFVLSCYDTPIYAELGEICDKYEFDAYSSVSQYAKKGERFARKEIVYATRVASLF